jgi:hypothetical protein
MKWMIGIEAEIFGVSVGTNSAAFIATNVREIMTILVKLDSTSDSFRRLF